VLRYHYGFEALTDEFSAEWLYAFPKGRRQKLFERRRDGFEFGRGLKGRNAVIADLTRPNSLFLSAANQNDHPTLSSIASRICGIGGAVFLEIHGRLLSGLMSEHGVDKRTLAFLNQSGVGIVDFRRRRVKLRKEEIEVQRALRANLQEDVSASGTETPELPTEWQALELAHSGAGGEPVYFELDRESAGTRRLLLLMRVVFDALDRGVPVFVDELDASLHAQVCESLLALFMSRQTNPKGAQLVATTHDTNLLRSPLLRRDQIWFTEKDAEGASCLYPLTDIRTRKGDDLEKGYLQGRYGAIPFAGPAPTPLMSE